MEALNGGMETTTLLDTGERMVPEFHKGNLIYAEHVTRYKSALPVVAGLTVLDIASGSGYGTNLLAQAAAHVYGVDLRSEAVAYANEHFGAPNIEFLVGDAIAIPLPDDSVDVVVTFETIEHVEDFPQFLREIKRVLKPEGIALVSTPNDLEFAEGNHFHVHEFEYDELMEVLGKSFTNLETLYQATWRYVAIGSEEVFANEGAMDIPTDNLAPLNRDQYLYFYVVCSDAEITRRPQVVAAVGSHYSERALVDAYNASVNHLEEVEADRKRHYERAESRGARPARGRAGS